MEHSHKPSSTATTSVRALTGAQSDPQEAAAEAVAPRPRTSEGPASEGAPEAEPSDASPPAHLPQEPSGSPPSPRSVHPVCWADLDEVRAWVNTAQTCVGELSALAREGSRRLKHHVLSRAERKRQTRKAERKLRALFEAAYVGLASLSAEEGGRHE